MRLAGACLTPLPYGTLHVSTPAAHHIGIVPLIGELYFSACRQAGRNDAGTILTDDRDRPVIVGDLAR